jgi:hypothetical protein
VDVSDFIGDSATLAGTIGESSEYSA